MDPQLLARLERVLAAGIEIVPDTVVTTHYVFTRDGFAALVEKHEGAFGHIGAPGLVTEQGFAALIWRGDEAFFVGKNFEQKADTAAVFALRSFDRDLREALS